MLWMHCIAILYLHILCLSMSPEQSVDSGLSNLCPRKCCLLAHLCVHAKRQDVIVFVHGRAPESMFIMRESCDRTREDLFASHDECLLFMSMQCVIVENASGETCMRRAHQLHSGIHNRTFAFLKSVHTAFGSTQKDGGCDADDFDQKESVSHSCINKVECKFCRRGSNNVCFAPIHGEGAEARCTTQRLR